MSRDLEIELRRRLFRLWDKHPYQMTLSDYYEETDIRRALERFERPAALSATATSSGTNTNDGKH